jgi:hypothetical protein
MRPIFKFPFIIFILAGLMTPVVNFSFGDIHGGGIDLGIDSPTENFYPSEVALNMKPSDLAEREIQVFNAGANPLGYSLTVERISGDDNFCNALQLEIVLEKEELVPAGCEFVVPSECELIAPTLIECAPEGPAPNLDPPILGEAYPPGEEPPEASEPRLIKERIYAYNGNLINANFGVSYLGTSYPENENKLYFTATLPSDAPPVIQNKTCEFKFIFTAQQVPTSGPEEESSTSTENVLLDMLSPNVALAYFTDVEIATNTLKSGQWVKPDFWIEKIDPVQVVWDSKINSDWKIDLVTGKPTMVRVYIGKKDYESLPKDLPVDVRLTFNVFDTKSKTIGDLEKSSWIDFYPFSLEGIGDYVVTAEVDPQKKIDESAEYNNSKLIIVTAKDTRGLYLINFPVEDYEGNKPDPSAYQKQITEGGNFILGTYPISPKEFQNPDGEEEFKATEDLTGNAGRIKALWRLWYSGGRATNWENDVAVGIVAEGSLGEGWHGVAPTIPRFGAVFVEENYWTLTAHEVGHVYGLWTNQEEYDISERSYPIEKAGFWVNKRIEMTNALCLMADAPKIKEDSWDSWLTKSLVKTWIHNDCYKNLFWKFLTNPTDPEVLIVGGIISKDGSISLGPSYRVPNGRIDKGESGDYSVKIFDINNEVIDEIPFDIRFQLHVTPGGIMETDIAPFGLSVPYTPDTSRVEISQNGQIIAEFNPNIKLLHDAVDLIPSTGFEKNPDQRRKALHNEIDAIEKILTEGNFQGAIQKLEHDIKDKLDKWLVDDYPREDLLQYAKDEIIDLVNKTIQRLSSLEK